MLPKHKRIYKFTAWITLIFLFCCFIFYKIDRKIKPTLFSVASAEVRIIATESINKIVKDELSKNFLYSDFVSIKTDVNGDISAIELNTVEMNKFGNNVSIQLQDEMKFLGGRGVDIPIGVVTGSSLLSYYGPKMNVKVRPLGNIVTDFKSELTSAGINQTRYRVYICIDTNLQIMIPFGKEVLNVKSTIPIAETLIVGKVPNSYFNATSGSVNVPDVIPIPINPDI